MAPFEIAPRTRPARAPVRRARGAGRPPTRYHEHLALAICDRIAEGETLRAICAEQGMPSEKTFRAWLVRYPQLQEMYSRARTAKGHHLFDEALDLVRKLTTGETTTLNAQQIRALDVALTHLRWSAGKLVPETYSERSQITVTVPIQINTSLDLGATREEDMYRVEATVLPDPEPPALPERPQEKEMSK